MKKFTLLTIILIIASQHSNFAQGLSKRDSLRAITFDKSLHDTTRLRAAQLFVNTFRYSMNDSMLHYARIFYDESVKADYLWGMAWFKGYEGLYYVVTGKPNEGMKCFLTGLKHAEASGRSRLIAILTKDVGSGYESLGMYDKAAEYLLKSIKVFREIGDKNALGYEIQALTNLNGVYMRSEHYQKGIDVSLRILTLVDSLPSGDKIAKAAALMQLGWLYMKTGKPEEAFRSYHTALQLFQQINNPYGYYTTLSNLVVHLIDSDSLNLYGKVTGDERKSVDIALAYLDELEEYNKNIQDSTALAHVTDCVRSHTCKREKI